MQHSIFFLVLQLGLWILSLGLVLENPSQNLATCALWHFINKTNTTSQLLVASNLGMQPVSNLRRSVLVLGMTVRNDEVCAWKLRGVFF